jgi:ferritin-like metal-binding protein YciE
MLSLEATMSEIMNLRDLFIFNMRRAYDAKRRLVKALPLIRAAASSSELRRVFQAHLEETELRVDRLLQVFDSFDEKPDTDTRHTMKGLIQDDDYAVLLTLVGADGVIKDAALAAAAQQVEQFEIATYGTLRTWAVALDKREAMEALEVTLEEEKNADTLLTGLAGMLNLRRTRPLIPCLISADASSQRLDGIRRPSSP